VSHVIDGRAYAAELMQEVKDDVGRLRGDAGIATLLVGDDYAAQVYQNRIDRHAQEAGMRSWMVRLPGSSSLRNVVDAIGELERNPSVAGVLVLRPLPAHLDESQVFAALPRLKDVEAQHPENAGLLALGIPRFIPSTPAAAFHMLDRYMAEKGLDPQTAYDGLNLVIVGRSPNVGKPAAILGLARNATVVSAHKHTSDAGRLADFTRQADLLIVAVGVPGLITGEMVREGAIVVDIGINPVDDGDGKKRLVGDVDFDSVRPRVEAVSPVPGGVGPITDVWVLKNALTAAHAQRAGR
jgi:methylenetetrahydrofolate dehydrogenase (NADP+) / methenyltetrahydrofolate cyclohydrolase